MRRREFLGVLGGATAWPLTAGARQQPLPMVGVLSAGSPSPLFTEAFVRGLKEAGFIERHNVLIDYRWANGLYNRVPMLADALIASGIDLLVTFGTPAARAAKPASVKITPALPVVFAAGSDPIAEGFVTSHSRPGGNMTGITSITGALTPKRVELVRELVQENASIAILVNPENPLGTAEREDAAQAAQKIGRQFKVLTATTEREIDEAFAALKVQRVGALIIGIDTFFLGQMGRMGSLAARHAAPAIGGLREFVVQGGLMSYGTSIYEVNRMAGAYAGKVLKGARPADLPVKQPNKFELVINVKAAKSLGIELSPRLLAVADEVIE